MCTSEPADTVHIGTSRHAVTRSHCCRLRRHTFVIDVYAVHSGRHSHHRCSAPRHSWSLLYLAASMSTVPVSAMDKNGEGGRDTLSTTERNTVAICDAVLQVCYAMCCGAFPRATPRWWMKRRMGGAWEDLRHCDDATSDYCKEKLRMSPRVSGEIAEALPHFLQRRVTFYREPLLPDHIVAYALYRWASGEMYESGTCGFDIGRSSGLVAAWDVTEALLSAYSNKISWPTGLQKPVVLRAFADKGFPYCHGCIDCTHIFIDKPANCPREDYYDRKHCFSVQAQVVVDLNLRVLDVFVNYPGSCHDLRIVHLLSLWACAEAGELFTGPPVMLPFGVQTNGYLLGDNGYSPSEWVVVPYGRLAQHPSELRFDNKQKTAR
ncbi:hypothetical protein CBR_g21157 [Chara braunii]|uniref:DDE Tnp4 domain-containing protein n=1 Tax=Chara braunii TaxID=69332 RepID=A0A388L0U2_CHABU|nr:hypothetical protein CBR_g21157 [Chara braunii]|eukprot:GBG75915.1 hypothetical protein CBR_g21157 [Chara braunii]